MANKNIKLNLDEIVSDDIDKDTLKNKLLDIGFYESSSNEVDNSNEVNNLSYPQPIDVYDPPPKNIENKVPEPVSEPLPELDPDPTNIPNSEVEIETAIK